MATTQTKKVGVIGTEGTIKSGAYEKAIKALAPEIEVISKPCPLFVPLAEEGWTDNDVARSATSRYLEDMKGVDTLVLGCTHYPLLKSSIASVMGTDVRLIDSGEETALEVRRVLSKEGLLRRLSQIGKRDLLCHGHTGKVCKCRTPLSRRRAGPCREGGNTLT